MRTTNWAGTVLLGLAWLGGVVIMEGYLRNGVSTGTLRKRALHVFLALVAVLGVSYALQLAARL